MSKVSVVLPVYKVEDYIENTLRSVVNQTYKDIEIILVDDGSPDKSINVAEQFLKNYKDIDWKIIHQENRGLSAARNRGIDNASGEWIICPDSDDYIDPSTISEMLMAAEKYKVDCVFCGHKSVTIDNIDEKSIDVEEAKIFDSTELKTKFLNREIILLVPGMLVRKDKYDKVKFDTSCPYDEDIHFLWRLLFECEKAVYIPTAFYNYLSRSTSMVHTLKPENYLKTSRAYAAMTEQLLKEHPDEDKLILRIHPKYRLGGLHVLAKANDYKTFKKTVMLDGYRKDMGRLIFYKNARLSLYAFLYCVSLKGFYKISR